LTADGTDFRTATALIDRGHNERQRWRRALFQRNCA